VVLGPLISALALAGCGLVRGSPKDREIVVTLAVSRTEAVRRTLATFREQGYRVRETLTSGANPVTEEFRHRDDADAVFRAAITGSAQSSRVVLSGTYRRLRLGGLMHDDERPVRNTDDDDVERELWARLSNLASTLRQSSGAERAAFPAVRSVRLF
jgi:hypothetical protein